MKFSAKHLLRAVSAFPFLLTLLITTAHAQNELLRERFSLQGIQEIGFTANIQGTTQVTGQPDLSPAAFRQRALDQLNEIPIRVLSDRDTESSADIPLLYLHVNTMELSNGLIPFSINLRLYQPVKLTLNQDLETSASTWESETIGVVSANQLHVISRAADQLITGFLDEFRTANR